MVRGVTQPRSLIRFCLLKEDVTLEQMVFRRICFCKVVGLILFTWFSYQFDLALLDSVFYPPVSHVKEFWEFLAEVGSGDAFCGGVVGQYAGSAGWLLVVEFGQRGDDGDCLLAADKDAACLYFSCGGDNVLEGFKNDLDGTVEQRASRGGVDEIEDAGDATEWLGEDEVSCVRLDVKDHVACME